MVTGRPVNRQGARTLAAMNSGLRNQLRKKKGAQAGKRKMAQARFSSRKSYR